MWRALTATGVITSERTGGPTTTDIGLLAWVIGRVVLIGVLLSAGH